MSWQEEELKKSAKFWGAFLLIITIIFILVESFG
jgi:hypothetical protein